MARVETSSSRTEVENLCTQISEADALQSAHELSDAVGKYKQERKLRTEREATIEAMCADTDRRQETLRMENAKLQSEISLSLAETEQLQKRLQTVQFQKIRHQMKSRGHEVTLECSGVCRIDEERWHDYRPNRMLRTIEEVVEGTKGRKFEDGVKEDLSLGLVREVGVVFRGVKDPGVTEEFFKEGFLDVGGLSTISQLPIAMHDFAGQCWHCSEFRSDVGDDIGPRHGHGEALASIQSRVLRISGVDVVHAFNLTGYECKGVGVE
ncbi:hypothetical protein B0H11DRAFT_1907420 [Mycena galericulata]|nr:hypothetical protein B0H11DRAFT_1907420 [Mycena galericulata]